MFAMKITLGRLFRNRIVRQASELVGWQVLTKILSFFTTAWMVRCMGPKNLGVSGLIIATSAACSLFINLGLDISGTRKIAVSKDGSRDIIELVIGLRWRIGAFLFALWVIYSIYLLFSKSEYFLAWVLGAFLMITSSLNTGWILQGLEELPVQNRIMCITSVLSAVMYVLFFRPGMPAGADIAVMTISNIVGLWLVWIYVRRRTGASVFGHFDYGQAKALLYESRWAFAIVCTVFVYLQLDMILLAKFASFEQAGAYRAASSLIVPLTLLAGISGTLLYPRLVVWHQQDPWRVWSRQKNIVLVYLITGIIGVGVISVAARPIMGLLFGSRYSAAVWPFIILFCSKVEVLISGVFGWGVMASGRDRLFLFASLAAASLSLCLNVIFIPRYGALAAATVNFVAEAVILLLTMYFCWQQHSEMIGTVQNQAKEGASAT